MMVLEIRMNLSNCSGPSMEPTIYENDILLTEHISTFFLRTINRGDIVVLRSPNNPKVLLCKRIAGLSGDTIKQGTFSSSIVPYGHVWLHGDNSYNSTDSRDFGPVPMGLILGKAIFKIWPPKRLT